MAKIDRYILSQLMGPFAIFALILIGVYWTGRAIGLFDQLIGDGQSVMVFLEIMILFLPQVVAIVLPVVSFAAAIYVSNRLHSESEMVVFQAAGFTAFRLMRPFLIFGVIVFLLASALSHYLVPTSLLMLNNRQHELADDMATRLIVGGKFLHPTDDVTFFVGDIKDDGSLIDIFLFDRRDKARDLTYTAHKAVLLRADTKARLVMFDGLIQTFDTENLLLTKIQFDEFVFDIGSLIGAPDDVPRRLQEYSTLALLSPTPGMLVGPKLTVENLWLEAHRRLEQPLQSLVYPLIGMAVLMLGSFSRFGVMRQVLGAIAVVVLLGTISVPLRDLINKDISLWGLIYAPDLLGFVLVGLMLRSVSRRGAGHGRTARTPDEVTA